MKWLENIVKKLSENKTGKKILNIGIGIAAVASLAIELPAPALASGTTNDTNISVSGSYQQNSTTNEDIYGTRVEAENNGFLLRAEHILEDTETTKWGVILPYHLGDVIANIELFGLDSNAGENGLGTRLRLDYKKFGIGGIFQNYKTTDGESQLFGPQFFINLKNLAMQSGVYRLEQGKINDWVANGIINLSAGNTLLGGMWKVSEKETLLGAGIGSIPKKKGESLGYLIYGEYSPTQKMDFESLHFLWGSNIGKRGFVPAFGITDDGDSEVTLFPIETDFQYNVAGIDAWTLPLLAASKAGLRVKHIGGKNSGTFVEEAAVFPFNMYDGPEFLKKLFVGGIATQTRVNGKTKSNLTGAIGYQYDPVSLYVLKNEGQVPAGYITFRKEF